MKKLKYLVVAPLFLPAIAFAQSAVGQGLQLTGLSGLFGGGLARQQTLPDLIIAVTELLLFFAGSIAILFIIIGGYYYITAQGNEETSEKGRKTLVNAIIGVVVVILSYAIIAVIQNTINASGY